MIDWYGTAYSELSPLESVKLAFKRFPFLLGTRWISQLKKKLVEAWIGQNRCPRVQCDGFMFPGKAIGVDHDAYERCEQITYIRDPVLVKVMKCHKCGHSVMGN